MASHDNGNVTEFARRPQKSILKLRDGNTMPMISLNDTDGRGPNKIVNRRVSFAEKVKLHQIDLVHVLQADWPESDLDLAGSGDSSDEDTSFLKLEADADKIVSSLAPLIIPKLNSDEDEDLKNDSDEEQTMELTGQIKELHDASKQNGQDTYLNQHGALYSLEGQSLQNDENGTIKSIVAEEFEETDMELTEPINKPPPIQNTAFGEIESTEVGDELTMDITKLQHVVAPAQDAPEQEEITMEVTKQFENIPQVQEPKTSSPIQIPVLEPLTEDEEDEPMNNEDEPMKLTQQLNAKLDNKETASVAPNSEERPDLNEIESQELAGKQEGEEQEMELTMTIVATYSEGQLVGISEATSKEYQAQVAEELTSGNSDSEIPENDRKENEEYVDSGVESRGRQILSSEEQKDLVDESHVFDHTNNGKRSFPNGAEHLPKRLHTESYVTSTTTIPLADVSMTSMDGDIDNLSPNVSLVDFLTDIGIKFYDDLEFSTDISNRYRLSLSDGHASVSPEDYFRANIQLPVLEVYELCCKELSGKIQEGMKLFDELKAETFENNPDLFKQYYRSSFYDQMTMKSRFHTLKEYTRQQAKQIWYQWRSKLIENILDVLKSNLEILQSDKAVLIDQISSLDSIYREIQQKYHAIRLEVLHFKDIQTRFQDLDVEQIKSIKSKLTHLNQQLIDHKTKISDKESELKELQSQINLRNEEIANLKQKISESDNKLIKTRHFNTTEIRALEFKSQILQAGAGLKYVKRVEEKVFEFQFNPRIKVTVDFSEPDQSNSITFLLLNNTIPDVLHNEHLLLTYCQKLAEQTGFTNIFDSFVSFRRKWLKITEIDRDIYQLSIRYPIEFNSESSDVIGFNFSYYSFEKKTKARCKVQISLDTILEYPRSVRFDIISHKEEIGAEIKRLITTGPPKCRLFRSFTEIQTS